MPYATSSPRVLEKRQRRREEILHAAMQSFRAKGYHHTTLDDIAQHLSIRKTALYHYFPDKEAILYECHRMSLAEVERLVDEARSQFPRARDQLHYIIREHVRVMIDTLQGSPSAFEVSSLLPVHQRAIIDGRDRYERGLRLVIQAGIARGEFRAVDPKTAVFAILGAINWIARWYQPDGALQASDLGAQFAEHLVGGLTCR